MDNYNRELQETAKQELKQAIEKYASLIQDEDLNLTRLIAEYHLKYEVDEYLFANFK